MSSYSEYDYIVKTVIVGDSAVGKTSLLLRYADDGYDDRYMATIGVDFRISTVESQNKIVKLQLWDTAGQERFRTITQNYYRGATAVVLCFDLTDQESFHNCNRWMADIEQFCPTDAAKILIGTKADLRDKRMVQFEDAQAFADRYGCPYFETSSKASTNVQEAFQKVVGDVVTIKEKQKVKAVEKTTVTFGSDSRLPRNENRTCFGWLRALF
jgi:Ras-related protein Rab-1A|uniref:Uncharacterized protein n=1 Tax=Eutreptiella gymnastica TaxID=73025 RepID=A0A7S4GNI4_9EUGL|eukprot:CAMPEP_0174285760 /NCGR_PEP_ID=MMETSP0809-20121228/9698_1 /TAXON_ID=73025 ORGANISM="Eutreptiella gymnastica-like, Strain CCMP1594" /NCGR_SAMPLE_ID=MMETSP0809 /ASSEMBLY_ACC=CAM_ASM_000658 /LENGTH=212 /DNA_ID=CAMNT_0015381611 /DNA_START=37 /DNA_END=675 /DNA_ORIENTATION=+